MTRLAQKLVKLAAAVLMLPAVYTAGKVLWQGVQGAPFFVDGAVYFSQGVFGYLLMHTLLWEPVWLYVLGHELTHALCGLFFFARITGFRVSRSGGEVTLSKSNFIISLGPYLVPFYTLLVCVAFLLFRTTGYAFLIIKTFLMTVGFTWGMHIVMTVKFIRMKQPDLIETGAFFSLALIALVNIVVLAGILSWAIPGFEFTPYVREAAFKTWQAYRLIFTQLFL